MHHTLFSSRLVVNRTCCHIVQIHFLAVQSNRRETKKKKKQQQHTKENKEFFLIRFGRFLYFKSHLQCIVCTRYIHSDKIVM